MRFDIQNHQWESEAQKKGFLSLFQYLKKHDIHPQYDEIPVHHLALYMIQKSHEAQEWWSLTFGEHIKSLENEIMKLREEIAGLKKN